MSVRLASMFVLGFLVSTAAFPTLAARPLLAVSESAQVAAPPAKTWSVIKDYGSLHNWNPVFTHTEVTKGKNNAKGAIRVLTTRDGIKITEELLAYSPKRMSMKYRIREVPIPITEYVSTIKVTPDKSGGSVVTWSSTFRGSTNTPKEGEDDASLKKLFSGVYLEGFETLKKLAAN